VVNLEKTNISDLMIGTLDPPIELCVVDLSYLSLTVAIPIAASLFRAPVFIIALVKPLYEGLKQNEVTDQHALRRVLASLFRRLQEEGVHITDAMLSPVLGGRGAVEFLILVKEGMETIPSSERLVDQVLQEYIRTPPTNMLPE
jgi:23S rRNA (cytidine1920-2'-O)/16S rRNA (cytidine1409-2'-O)-methyltransferase